LNSELWKQQAKAFTQDPHSQHECGLAASSQSQEQHAVTVKSENRSEDSSQGQVAADGRRYRVDLRLLLDAVSPARACLFIRIT